MGIPIDIPYLASVEVTQGVSGAEIVAICRDAALLALEESDSLTSSSMPKIEMRHLELAMKGMQRQITPSMISFYESYRNSARSNVIEWKPPLRGEEIWTRASWNKPRDREEAAALNRGRLDAASSA